MSEVRPFTRNDVSEVADLFASVFLSNQSIDLNDLRSYFETVYFDNPFRDIDLPSLVFCDSNGEILAFLGVMPRPMRFRGETIKAAIAGNLMFKGGGKAASASMTGAPLAAAALAKAFFRFPFDLGLTDSAIEPSRKIWERLGGNVIRLYSLRWTYAIRPIGFGLDTLERRGRFRSLLRLARPLGGIADRITRPLIAPAKPSALDGCTIEDIRPEEMAEELARCRHYDLTPDYSATNLAWVIKMAASRRGLDTLRALLVRDQGGGCLGWAIYSGAPDEVGQVLQLYARPETFDRVFDGLLREAAKSGLSALSGKADPLFIEHLGKNNCILRTNVWTLATARRPELLEAFFVGKAMFSELESEGWTRFLHANPRREFATR